MDRELVAYYSDRCSSLYVYKSRMHAQSLHMAMQDGLKVAMVVPWGRNCRGGIKGVVTGEDRYAEVAM